MGIRGHVALHTDRPGAITDVQAAGAGPIADLPVVPPGIIQVGAMLLAKTACGVDVGVPPPPQVRGQHRHA